MRTPTEAAPRPTSPSSSSGTDTTTLYRLADEAARRLDTMDGVEDVSRPRSTGRREIQVSLDRDRIAELGRTATDITQVLGFSLGGVRLDRFNAGDREIITWLALRMEDRARLDDLRQIPVAEFRRPSRAAR